MEARARVLAVEAGRLRLECADVPTSCGACAGRRGCALRWLAGDGPLEIEVEGPAAGDPPPRPGDGIVIEVDDRDLLRAAALAYLPPLAGLLSGAAFGATLAPGHEPVPLAGAILGLVAGWGAARTCLRRFPPRYRLRSAGAS